MPRRLEHYESGNVFEILWRKFSINKTDFVTRILYLQIRTLTALLMYWIVHSKTHSKYLYCACTIYDLTYSKYG